MKATASRLRILIAKTTHLGDVVISLPMPASMKRQCTDSTLLFLTHPRTLDVAAQYLDVDAVYAAPENFADFVAFTSKYLANAAKAAGIKIRVGSAFHWYNWLLVRIEWLFRGAIKSK